MAKPLQTHDIEYNMALTKAAGLIVAVKSHELWAPVKIVRAGDVEGVHDMRVSSKRLRETLRIFRPILPKSGRRCLLHVDELNDVLGQVRDRDVLLLRLQELAAQVPADAGLLDELSANISAEREQHFAALMATLDDHAGKKRTQTELKALANKLGEMTHGLASLPVGRFTHAAIVQRLISVFADNSAARDPDNIAAFHALRIKVKKLKYTIEPFLSILPERVKPAYKQIAALQEEMGIVHDDDVLSGVLETFTSECRPKRKTSPSLKHLRAIRQERHTQVIATLSQMEANDFPRQLMDALD